MISAVLHASLMPFVQYFTHYALIQSRYFVTSVNLSGPFSEHLLDPTALSTPINSLLGGPVCLCSHQDYEDYKDYKDYKALFIIIKITRMRKAVSNNWVDILLSWSFFCSYIGHLCGQLVFSVRRRGGHHPPLKESA